LFDDEELSFIEQSINSTNEVKTAEELYEDYQKLFLPKPEKKKVENTEVRNLFNFDDLSQQPSEEIKQPETYIEPSKNLEVKTDTSLYGGQRKTMTKEEFVKNFSRYKSLLISTPKILVTPTSKIEFKHFDLQRSIFDFDVAASKIERYDAINKELLTSIEAITLVDDNPINTLACMLLDSMCELSSDDAEFVLDMVNQYLNLIDGSIDDKKKIVRRYAKIIIDDIVRQIKQNMINDVSFTYKVQQDYITFKNYYKNIKTTGILNCKKPFDDKKNIRKYIFEGYKKSYYSQNEFDSDTERIFSLIIDDDPTVLKWIRLPLDQLGIFWKNGSQYNPDFIIETNTDKYIIEIKAANEQDNPDVVSKAKEAIKWCEYATLCDKDKKKWNYRLIVDTNIKLGNNFKYTIGLAKDFKE